MAIRIVQLGSPRTPGEGPRLGTVRRPPRGVPKSQYAKRNYYDVWLPILSPSAALIQTTRAVDSQQAWSRFLRRFQAEMNQPDASRTLDLLAELSHHANFSLGCYCADEDRCHRSILRKLLKKRRAKLVG